MDLVGYSEEILASIEPLEEPPGFEDCNLCPPGGCICNAGPS
jgi:hypothetical protein